MKKIVALLAALFAAVAFSQSVPNGTIQPGQVWTVPQWNSAWQSKADLTTTPSYVQTAAEISAGVTPVQYGIAPCNVNRYGLNTTPGTTDMSTAFSNAAAACTTVYAPAGTYVVQLTMPNVLQFVLRGDGPSTILKQKGSGPVLAWSTAAVVYNEQTVKDLAFDGTNGGTHTIVTAGAGGLTLLNLYFVQIPTGFDSIFVNGAASTVVHDTRLINIQIYGTQAGAVGLEFGALTGDTTVSQFIMNGNFTTANCIQVDSGAVAIAMSDSHPYNCATHVLQITGGSFLQFTHDTFDNASGGDNTLITGASSNIVFTGSYFEAVPSGKNAVTITNSNGITFVNDMFQSASGAGYAVTETGTSNNNNIFAGNISVNTNWTAPIFNLLGASSSACSVPGAANNNCPVLKGTTGSIGGGALTVGTCTSGTASVTSSTTAMAVSASPVTYPGDGIYWVAYVSAAGTVTVKVCATASITPTASTYNVRVLQ